MSNSSTLAAFEKFEAMKKDAAVARRRRTRKAKRQAVEATCVAALLTEEECQTLFDGWKAKPEGHRTGGEALAVEVVTSGAVPLVQAVRLAASKKDYTNLGKVRLVSLGQAEQAVADGEVSPF